MVSSANEVCSGGSYTDIESSTVPLLVSKRGYAHLRVDIPPRQSRWLHLSSNRRRGVLGWFMDPFSMFRRAVDRREEASLSVPSPAGIGRRLRMRFMRKIDWASLAKACKELLKNPMNVALLLWLICVAVFLSLLFLLLTELVDGAFPTKALRNRWIEICNQVLNALFTLMSLYQHPNLCHHLVLLCRWRSGDIVELRKVYCKNGAYRPHEWAHMMVVVFLLQLTCFAQYVLCGLYWGFRGNQRPEFVEYFFVGLGVIAPVLAGVYTVYSPLGGEYDLDESEEESQGHIISLGKGSERGLNLLEQRVAVSRPEWAGELFDLGDDVPVAFLSFFCTCCVFGWNMGRLGFGNTYVHIATFVLLFIAPYWVFSISAFHIQNAVLRHALRITGLVLSLLCLFYGGFWRIQIRRRFRLPVNTLCGEDGSMTDYVQWMFCWGCSLAQEVRTGNMYDVEEDSLYKKHRGGGACGDEGIQPVSPPATASSDGGDGPPVMEPELDCLQVLASQPVSVPSRGRVGDCSSADRDEGSSSASRTMGEDAMVPPAPLLMQVTDRDCSSADRDEGSSSTSRTMGEDAMVPPAPLLMQVTDRDCEDCRADRLNSPEDAASLPSE